MRKTLIGMIGTAVLLLSGFAWKAEAKSITCEYPKCPVTDDYGNTVGCASDVAGVPPNKCPKVADKPCACPDCWVNGPNFVCQRPCKDPFICH